MARKVENAIRDTEIVRMKANGDDPRLIADQFGITVSRVSQVWNAALRAMPQQPIEDRRREADEMCTRQIAKLTEHMDKPRTSARTVAEISRVINSWETRRAALLGLDAPRRQEVHTIDGSSWEAQMRVEIARMETEHERRAAEANRTSHD